MRSLSLSLARLRAAAAHTFLLALARLMLRAAAAFGVVLLVLAAPAFAQEGQPAPTSDGSLLKVFLQYVLPVLIPPLFAGVTWVLAQLALWLKAREKDSKLAAVAGRVAHLADMVVHEVDAVVRPKLKSALEDGVLTPEEGAELKKIAMDKLKQLLAEQGLAELQGVLGIFLPQVETYLSGAIEAALERKKALRAEPVLGAPVPA